MFNRALNYITSLLAAAAPTEEKGGDDETPPLSTPAAMVDEYSHEDPLLPTTTDEDIEAPPPYTEAATVDEDNLENIPTLSSTDPDSIGTRIINITRDPRCEWVIVCSLFLILFAIAVFYFVVNVNGISNDPGFRLDSVTVSSFNVSKNLDETTWDTALSLKYLVEGSKDADVRYEAPRLWLYSRDGFVSPTSFPSLQYSPDGKKLILHAVFDSMQKEVERGQVVSLDMLMELNTMRVVNVHVLEVEFRWVVTIDCNSLKIEFDSLSNRFGRLIDNDGDHNSCKVQVCTLESHPLYDGAHKCTTSSSDLRSI